MSRRDVMLCLAGGQPTPNVVGALQPEPPPTQVVFLASPQTLATARQQVAFLAALGMVGAEPVVVAAHDLPQVVAACEGVVARFGPARLCFNITGGTKIMALGANLVAERHAIPALYVDSANERVLTIALDPPAPELIRVRLSVADCLSVHGLTIVPGRSRNPATLPGTAWAAARAIAAGGTATTELLHLLRKHRTRGVPLQALARPQIAAADALRAAGALVMSPASRLVPADPALWPVLNGEWLELAAYDAALAASCFDECRAGLFVRNHHGVENEHDLVCVVRNRLLIASCKTERRPAFGVLTELDALARQAGGTFVRRLLITDAPNLSPAFHQRARDLRIRLVGAGDLPALSAIFAEEASRPPPAAL